MSQHLRSNARQAWLAMERKRRKTGFFTETDRRVQENAERTLRERCGYSDAHMAILRSKV